ncbi:Chromosome partition protein smc [Streptococcus sp. DD12]|nr:Chromosome partition protein smc [Streptococcus sp. DD12]
MYLKAIEIQGFKSFADKTKISFDTGVTAIVGPNGSGKSNVTESLRWALGESSAKSLRGGKMADVIFAGTQNRSPLNSAQVRVSLDNSDGYMAGYDSDIQVERRVYRNGDSDYLINGKKVRLRDIHDLFMDTGLGRDSFSVISQGRVESIFNSKPEERRAIFEEAAGVLKYKTRKKETQNKLTHTQDNLDRLKDIIYELDSQVGPLKKQAQTAQRFLELDQKRESLALDVLVHDVKSFKEEKIVKEKELQEAQEALATYYERRDKLEKDNQTLKQDRQTLAASLQEEQAALRQLTGLIADLEGRIRLSRLQKEQAQAQSQEQESRLRKAQERQQTLGEAIVEKGLKPKSLKRNGKVSKPS